MRHLLVLITYFSTSFVLYSQDIIYLKDGDIIEAKILEIDNVNIKYLKFNYLDGPTFTIYKSKIYKIRFNSGDIEYFGPVPASIAYKNDSVYGNNIVTYNLLSVTYRILKAGYEWQNNNMKWGIKIPAAIGFDGKSYEIGADLKYYLYLYDEILSMQAYLGPSVKYGNIFYFDRSKTEETSFNIIIGGLLNLSRQLVADLNFGTGARTSGDSLIPTATMNIGIGIRF